jgi:hypothetical protein
VPTPASSPAPTPVATEVSKQETPVAPAPPEPATHDSPATDAGQADVTTKPTHNAPKAQGGPVMVIILSIVVVVALAAVAYYAYTNSKM